MNLHKAFSNNDWSINIQTVGQLIDELSRLPRELPIHQGFEESADVIVFNRNTEPHVSFAEGGDWTE